MSSSRSPNPKVPKKPRTIGPSSQISPQNTSIPTPSIPVTGYSKNRTTGPEYYDYLRLNMAYERFVKFSDFGDFNLEEIFEKCGLDKFLSISHKYDEIYPEILAMFYANMKREEKKIIKTTIHRVQVTISLKEIGEILEIPSNGIRLEEVEVEDDKFKDMIAKPNSPSKIEYKHLTSLGKLISRIISYNILPKTGSYTHISNDQFKAMYAIVKHLEVNWARVIYEFIKTKPSHFLAFPKSIIKLLKVNKISPTGKGKICEAIIDYTTLKRMGLDRGEDREEELEENPETPVASNT